MTMNKEAVSNILLDLRQATNALCSAWLSSIKEQAFDQKTIDEFDSMTDAIQHMMVDLRTRYDANTA